MDWKVSHSCSSLCISEFWIVHYFWLSTIRSPFSHAAGPALRPPVTVKGGRDHFEATNLGVEVLPGGDACGTGVAGPRGSRVFNRPEDQKPFADFISRLRALLGLLLFAGSRPIFRVGRRGLCERGSPWRLTGTRGCDHRVAAPVRA